MCENNGYPKGVSLYEKTLLCPYIQYGNIEMNNKKCVIDYKPYTFSQNKVQQFREIQDNIITPSFYFDMTKKTIGNRPIVSSRNTELNIPNVLLNDKDNLTANSFNCHQPYWGKKCK